MVSMAAAVYLCVGTILLLSINATGNHGLSWGQHIGWRLLVAVKSLRIMVGCDAVVHLDNCRFGLGGYSMTQMAL